MSITVKKHRNKILVSVQGIEYRLTEAEAEELITELLGQFTHYPDTIKMLWHMRTAPTATLVEFFTMRDGEIVVEGYELHVHSGRGRVSKGPRCPKQEEAVLRGTEFYGRAVPITDNVRDESSYAAADRQMLIYKAEKYCRENGITMNQLLRGL